MGRTFTWCTSAPWASATAPTAVPPFPEGYLKVEVPQPDGSRFEEEILHPASPGSVYHMAKTLDQLLFLYYNKNDKVRITDLHQGIVWGTNTDATDRDPRLTNRFDYDGDYGTVLNRFLMQAAIGYPLTVHGTGGRPAPSSTSAIPCAASNWPWTTLRNRVNG